MTTMSSYLSKNLTMPFLFLDEQKPRYVSPGPRHWTGQYGMQSFPGRQFFAPARTGHQHLKRDMMRAAIPSAHFLGPRVSIDPFLHNEAVKFVPLPNYLVLYLSRPSPRDFSLMADFIWDCPYMERGIRHTDSELSITSQLSTGEYRECFPPFPARALLHRSRDYNRPLSGCVISTMNLVKQVAVEL